MKVWPSASALTAAKAIAPNGGPLAKASNVRQTRPIEPVTRDNI